MTQERQSKSYGLSKSRVMSWLQCTKRLWLETYRREAAQPSDGTQRLLSAGQRVGRVAQDLQPGGVLIGWQDQLSMALAETRAHIEAGTRVLFEPAFQHQGILVRADILQRRQRAYRLREVKASASVSKHHYLDAAIQAWVLRGSGLKLDSVSIQHIDTSFVYEGAGDYKGLFKRTAVDDQIRPLAKEVAKWLAGAQATLAGREPKRKTGKHCTTPFVCPCLAYCASKEPQSDYPLTVLPHSAKLIANLTEQGFRDVREIPEELLRSDAQKRVWRVTNSGKAELDREARKAVAEIPFPRYYFDFETVSFAVPLWPGTRPYQQIPFQWSCHIERSPGKLEHRRFLDVSGNPPMRVVADSMLAALGDEGAILSHNAGFETRCITELAKMVPSRAKALRALLPRFVDTLPLVKAHYYHPVMRGSWSLKQVLPTIAPELSYGKLDDVRDGSDASAAYLEIIASETLPERKAQLQAALERYCERDTLGLVRLVQFLGKG